MSPLRKTHPLLSYGDSFLNLACPKNITAFWSFGSMLGVCLVTQILTGLFLAMYYASDMTLAFDSVLYISRDVNYGWLIRSIHANSASMFFVCLYLHVGRGLYYGSYVLKETWMIGVTLFLLTIITAFLGYVLPWGQMSYWAATVITNLLSSIPYMGSDIVAWIWGGFSVSNASLVRFYAFHFLFPFIIAFLSVLHLLFLHETGSGNPLGVNSDNNIIKFHPYFSVKDLVGFLLMWMFLFLVVFFYPNLFTDPENFMKANPLVTPTHIQPEWYFLPMYAILRSVPSKLGGVIALILSVAILYFLPFMYKPVFRSSAMNPISSTYFWWFIGFFIILGWIGKKPVEYPYETIGQVFSIMYFTFYFILPLTWTMDKYTR